jgi:hypothetical protein
MLASANRGSGLIYAAALGGGLLLALALAALASGVAGAGGFALGLSIALTPVAFYFALRYPLIVPFGLYVALVPYDAILSVASSGVTVTRIVGLACGGALLLNIVLRRRFCAPPRSWYAWAAAVLWMALSALWTIDGKGTSWVLGIVVQSFALYTVLVAYPPRRVEVRALTWIVVVAGLALSAMTAFEYAQGVRLGGNRITIETASGVFVDPNHLAANLVLPICIVMAALFLSRRGLTRVGLGCALAALMVGVLLSSSRGALVACAFALVYMTIRTRKFLVAGLASLAGIALMAAFPTVWERFFDPAAGEGSGRLDIWRLGLQALKEHWLAGAGIGSYPMAYDRAFLLVSQHSFEGWSRPSHNLILGTSVELGVIGLALVLSAWWLSSREARSVPPPSPLYPLAIAAETAILSLFVVAMFVDTLLFKYVWLAFAFAVFVRNLDRSERRYFVAVTPGPVPAPMTAGGRAIDWPLPSE